MRYEKKKKREERKRKGGKEKKNQYQPLAIRELSKKRRERPVYSDTMNSKYDKFETKRLSSGSLGGKIDHFSLYENLKILFHIHHKNIGHVQFD